MKALVRRTAAVLALILPAAGLVLAAGVPQASACSLSGHCYAIGINNHVAANHGVYGDLYLTCLYQPENGNFVTNEVWDSEQNGSYWVEAGIGSGANYHGGYILREWFWATQFPGANYYEDDTGVVANLTTTHPVEITYTGGGSWNFIGENNTVIFGTATASFSATQAQGGTEYTSNAGSGIRDIGNIFDLQNQGLNGTWYYLGSAASNVNAGPGHFINGSYNPSTSEESWSGPC